MKAGQAKLEIQKILGIPESEQFPNIGPKTKAQLALLAKQSNDSEWPLSFDTERHVNQDGLELIKHFEGLYLKAYKDPVGIWTIGYGHTGLTHQDGTVYEGRKITRAEAEQLLRYARGAFEQR